MSPTDTMHTVSVSTLASYLHNDLGLSETQIKIYDAERIELWDVEDTYTPEVLDLVAGCGWYVAYVYYDASVIGIRKY